ncbi:hypothetical protein EVG20_g6202 [Dentipellis fragilis]|uniref:Uncharacterized protein n=1 Tax=Dentipellis fragilis TaxID=205917 RepID=A0A4Y9YMA5_9AGAM|nr:hypothetical protein EVG20_g6202 [Dentipellis fragilis]
MHGALTLPPSQHHHRLLRTPNQYCASFDTTLSKFLACACEQYIPTTLANAAASSPLNGAHIQRNGSRLTYSTQVVPRLPVVRLVCPASRAPIEHLLDSDPPTRLIATRLSGLHLPPFADSHIAMEIRNSRHFLPDEVDTVRNKSGDESLLWRQVFGLGWVGSIVGLATSAHSTILYTLSATASPTTALPCCTPPFSPVGLPPGCWQTSVVIFYMFLPFTVQVRLEWCPVVASTAAAPPAALLSASVLRVPDPGSVLRFRIRRTQPGRDVNEALQIRASCQAQAFIPPVACPPVVFPSTAPVPRVTGRFKDVSRPLLHFESKLNNGPNNSRARPTTPGKFHFHASAYAFTFKCPDSPSTLSAEMLSRKHVSSQHFPIGASDSFGRETLDTDSRLRALPPIRIQIRTSNIEQQHRLGPGARGDKPVLVLVLVLRRAGLHLPSYRVDLRRRSRGLG